MSGDKAETIVVVGASITFASVLLSKLSDGDLPSGRLVAATLISFGAISALVNVAPEVAAGLSIAIAGSAFTAKGIPLLVQTYPDKKVSR